MTNQTAPISDREREILRLVATGATNQQIAAQLNISINTVKVHLRNIFSKVGAASRTEATLYAVRAGLVPIGQATLAPPLAAIEVAEAPDIEVAEAPEIVPEDSLPPIVPEWPPNLEQPAAIASRLDETSFELNASAPAIDPPAPALPGRDWRLVALAVLVLLVLVGLGVYLLANRVAPAGPNNGAQNGATAGVAVPDASERWHELAPLPAARASFALASYTYEGRRYLYAIGGDAGAQASDQVLRYDVAANTWVPLSVKPTAVSDVQSVVIGGKIFVPGGRLASGQISDKLESYDPQQDRWSAHKPLPAPRSGYALAVVEGKLYLFGGWDGKSYQSDVWEYDPGRDEWVQRKAMPTARAFAAASVVENAVYVVGGVNDQGSLTTNERYIPSEDNTSGNPWAVKAKLPAAAEHMAAAAISDQVFILGGKQGANQLLIYTVGTDSWRADAFPLAATADLRAQAIANKIYIVGGRGDSAANAQVYAYQAIYSVLLPAISN